METKKSREKDAEKLRIPLIFSGLLFTGGMLLASFTHKTTLRQDLDAPIASNTDEVIYTQETEKPVAPEVKRPKIKFVAPPQPKYKPTPPDPTPPKPVPGPLPPPPAPMPGPGEVPKAEVILFPDKDAEFKGGSAELMRWISSQIHYPEMAIINEDQGKVYVSFIVETDGSITNLNIMKGVTKDLDREAKRVIRNMPEWIPGEVAGKKVRTKCSIPIVFVLK